MVRLSGSTWACRLAAESAAASARALVDMSVAHSAAELEDLRGRSSEKRSWLESLLLVPAKALVTAMRLACSSHFHR